VIFPSVALVMTVLSFNFLGDALRDWLDPRNLG
jgi:peptide/nickel transport system permease protein